MKKKLSSLSLAILLFVALTTIGTTSVWATELETEQETEQVTEQVTEQESEQTETTVTKKTSKTSIKNCEITLSTEECYYSGNSKKPGVTVTYEGEQLVKGKDYKLSYQNNLEPGTAKVIVTGKGNFKDKVGKKFSILVKPTTVTTQISGKNIIVQFKKINTADGYVIYRREKGTKEWTTLKKLTSYEKTYTDTNASANKTYTYAVRTYVNNGEKDVFSTYSKSVCKCQPNAVTITSDMPLSSSSVELTWNLVSQADGYIIYQKKNDKWKAIKTIDANATNHTKITGLTYGETYSFSVRAYWKSNGQIIKGTMNETGVTEKLAYTYKYKGDYRLYYDDNGDLITDVDGIIGKRNSYSIKVNRVAQTATVYTKDPDMAGKLIPVKVFATSTGTATPFGDFHTLARYRWHELDHGVQGQWCTRIDTHILFHSVYYYSQDKQNLAVAQYNKLGTKASAGCVRLNCESAKWIFDNCAIGTKVTFIDSKDPGPLGKPAELDIPYWHKWDPTDPTCQDLCKQHHCHQEL